MRHTLLILIALFALPTALLAEVTAEMRLGINFPGFDLGNLTIADNDPATCMAACESHDECVAWTFVKPGIQGAAAVCWLKDNQAPEEVSECCISGSMAEIEASAAGAFYADPSIGAHSVDYCLRAGEGCGQAVADAFCQSFGYAGASEFSSGPAQTTYALGSQLICEGRDRCVAIQDVTCTPK